MSNQLVKRNPVEGYKNVFPKTFIDAIKDRESGLSLLEIIQGFNMYFLSYNGSVALTRCKVPKALRKEGLWITYVLYDHTVVTEWYNSDDIDDTSWGSDSNWRKASNALVGDISISTDGYWVINGATTNIKAQGETGITPLLRFGDNNKFQVSYNEGKGWEDISGDITNNLKISKYIGINEALPTSGIAEGTIYMKGPYYDENDTNNDNPIYRMWVYAWKGNTLAWQDNGEFTSISAGVVQERGTSTTQVMSQDAVTRELTELELALRNEIGENLQLNLYNAQFETSNTTNWTVENGEDYFIITHNNTYSTGSPYADINLPSGSYVLSADFSQSSQKHIELYVDDAWIKNIGNGQAFEIDDTKVSCFRFAPTTQGTWKVTDIKVMNYNAVDIKDLSQQVQNVGELVSRKSFVGIGDAYTSTLITGLQPSGKYRCYIHNKQWKRSEISIGGNYGFNIASEVNGAFVDLVVRTTLELSTLADYYDFVIPSNSNGTIEIGGRADVGEEVQFSVINISDIIMQGSTDMDFIGKVVPINVFDARSFVTTNTTNWTLTLLKDYIRVTHNNTYSTGSPYSPLELPEGEYLFAADFSEATLQKHINLYKNGAWYKNLTNGVTFEIEAGASYELSYAPSAQGTSIVKNISIVKAGLLPLAISVDGALLTQHCNNLNKDADVDSFLFFTDPHLLNEGLIDLGRSTYIQTIKAYADNLPINNVICGGDWINNFADIKEAARCLGYINGYMSNVFANYQLIVGNHEYNKYIEGQEALTVKAIRNLYTNREKNYYTFDSALSRFIVFDSGIDIYNHLMDAYKWEQIAWFASLLKENVDHNVIMLHISYVGDSVSALLNNITLMAKAYNTRSAVTLNGVAYDFSGASGKVHLVISGHTHEDATYMLNDVPVVITTDLRSGNTPTFDLFAVNYGESKAYLTRVGNGESRVVEIVA